MSYYNSLVSIIPVVFNLMELELYINVTSATHPECFLSTYLTVWVLKSKAHNILLRISYEGTNKLTNLWEILINVRSNTALRLSKTLSNLNLQMVSLASISTLKTEDLPSLIRKLINDLKYRINGLFKVVYALNP
jgi:hypothetical protein